jgi:LysM repeat protein
MTERLDLGHIEWFGTARPPAPTMRRDHRQPAGPRPFDLEADRQADVTQQFWGATRDWEADPDQAPADDMWAERTGSMRAIRDGLTAFKPRRGEPTRGRSGGIDRTRSHGIVRPAVAPDESPTGQIRRVDPETSLADLAAGRRAQLELDWPDEDDWSLPDSLHTGAMARVDSTRVDAVSGPVRRTRSHTEQTGRLAVVPPPSAAQRRRGAGRAAPVQHDDDHRRYDGDLIPLSSSVPLAQRLGLGAVDPLLLRLGALILVGVLAVPFAVAGRDGADTLASAEVAAAAVAAPGVEQPTASAVAPVVEQVPATAAPEADAPTAADQSADVDDADIAPGAGSSESPSSTIAVGGGDDGDDDDDGGTTMTALSVDDVQDAVATTTPPEVAEVSEGAERLEPSCSLVYTVAAGDSWYRIADAAGVSMQSVLDANLAGVESVILPGDEICLPEGATIPPPPTTVAPTTTAPPATTAAPTTTRPPSTTTAPPAPASTADVQRLIREIWPDELEERALQIAWRESNYIATAYNGICCYGVFQMHWVAHRSWLDDYGITSTNDLLDARKNITAAYALYQRAGGWGPWGG